MANTSSEHQRGPEDPLEKFPQCCCSRFKHLEAPVGINDTIHEPLGPAGNFCGPRDSHTIRDLLKKVEDLKKELDDALAVVEAARSYKFRGGEVRRNESSR